MTHIGRSSRRQTVVVPGADGVLELGWAALSDRGHRRDHNEDSLLARLPVFAVADGMGGHTAGDVASAAVVSGLADRIATDFVGSDDITGALRDAVVAMHAEVDRTDLGTGTTVSGIALTLMEGVPQWLVFNIGDSRVYRFLDGTLDQISKDHSIVRELQDAGLITAEEAEVHPHQNVITRAVGFNEDPVPDYWLTPVIAGSRMLICSDGLTKELTDEGLRHVLEGAETAGAAARYLVDASLQNGGRDNVTVIVVDVLATPDPVHGRRSSRRAPAPTAANADDLETPHSG